MCDWFQMQPHNICALCSDPVKATIDAMHYKFHANVLNCFTKEGVGDDGIC